MTSFDPPSSTAPMPYLIFFAIALTLGLMASCILL
jgi:hypothetical protein